MNDIRQPDITSQLFEVDPELGAFNHRWDKSLALKQAMMLELLTGKTRLVATGTRKEDSETTGGSI